MRVTASRTSSNPLASTFFAFVGPIPHSHPLRVSRPRMGSAAAEPIDFSLGIALVVAVAVVLAIAVAAAWFGLEVYVVNKRNAGFEK